MNKELLEFKKNLKLVYRIAVVVLGLMGVLLFTIVALLVIGIASDKKPTTYGECIQQKDAVIVATNPARCITNDEVFIAPVTLDRY
jgi:hypothetical protein